MTDLDLNPFYNFLKNDKRQLYQNTALKCWTICIPLAESIAGFSFSQAFLDSHILKSDSCDKRHFTSNSTPPLQYELKDNRLFLISKDVSYFVTIVTKEVGYNFQHKTFNLFVVDKPVNPNLKPLSSLVSLQNTKITCYKDVLNFLKNFFDGQLDVLKTHLKQFVKKLNNENNLETLIREEIKKTWATFLKLHSIEWQRTANFQYLLSVSIENFIIENVYETLFPLICNKHKTSDKFILEKCKKLSELKITADQLGASEDYAVPLPAAVVELASLDKYRNPIDKLLCLKSAYDLILAELKGAIVDAICESPVDVIPPYVTLDNNNIVPLLMTVIIRSKPVHMATNLYFMENFQWTLLPNDEYSVSLNTFKTAVDNLNLLDSKQLPARSPKIHVELGLDDLIRVTDELNERFERNGMRSNKELLSPLDRHLERLTDMIAASTEEMNIYEC